MNTKQLLMIALLAISASAAGASRGSSSRGVAEAKSARSFSIDSGYLPFLQSNRAMNHLWVEYEGLGSAVFDLVNDKTFVGSSALFRIPWGILTYFGWGFLNYGFFVGNHEVGHGSRLLALGSSPRYFWDGGISHASVFSFLGEGFFRYGSRAFTSGSNYNLVTSVPSDWGITVSSGGMNNSMMFAEALQDEIFYGGGHLNQLAAYVRAKRDAYDYAKYSADLASSDVSANISQWNSRGYSINSNDIAAGAAVSALASFSTYAYAWSALRYAWNGDPVVSPLALGAFLLPDLSFFQNRYGLSYRLRSAIDRGEIAYPWSIEYVYKGSSAVELSLGIRSAQPILLFQVFLSSLPGGGLRVVKQFGGPIGSSFFIGASAFTLTSLEGERNLGLILSPGMGLEGWGRWSWGF